jgi:hypothetical protein
MVKIILKWILEEKDVGMWTVFVWLKIWSPRWSRVPYCERESWSLRYMQLVYKQMGCFIKTLSSFYPSTQENGSRLALHCSCASKTPTLFMNTKQTPWLESASELYRPSDCHLSAKLVPTCEDSVCYVVSVTDPYCHILVFLDRSPYFFM